MPLDATQQAILDRAKARISVLEAEAQSLKLSLDEARARLQAVELAIAENGGEQGKARQEAAALEAESLGNAS